MKHGEWSVTNRTQSLFSHTSVTFQREENQYSALQQRCYVFTNQLAHYPEICHRTMNGASAYTVSKVHKPMPILLKRTSSIYRGEMVQMTKNVSRYGEWPRVC
jgi:hypothetical protein